MNLQTSETRNPETVGERLFDQELRSMILGFVRKRVRDPFEAEDLTGLAGEERRESFLRRRPGSPTPATALDRFYASIPQIGIFCSRPRRGRFPDSPGVTDPGYSNSQQHLKSQPLSKPERNDESRF